MWLEQDVDRVCLGQLTVQGDHGPLENEVGVPEVRQDLVNADWLTVYADKHSSVSSYGIFNILRIAVGEENVALKCPDSRNHTRYFCFGVPSRCSFTGL